MRRAAPDTTAISALIVMLREHFPGRVETGEALRRQHANALTWIDSEPPDAVVWPETVEDVAAAVRLAARHRVPVIAFGAGTSLEGHVNAPSGGISLDLSRMNRILRVNRDDFDAEVEAGVTRGQLNQHLRDTGLFFSVDPGAEEATIGGMAATRASGTNTVRYGSMRDNVLSLEAVLADGSIVKTGGRARKSAAGYDLTRLLIGSEGTLGIITRLAVRLHPVPETIVAAVCTFSSIGAACTTAIEATARGLALARIELLDGAQIQAVNLHAGLTLAETPTLFVEFHGSAGGLKDEIGAFEEVARGNGALGFEWAAGHADRNRLWAARHNAFWAVKSAWPGKSTLVTDVCVPVSRLAECLVETEADIKASGLIAPIVGHVGDGNFHAIVVFDAANPREKARVQAFVERLTARALALEGTCTGEHGIGAGKIDALAAELGDAVDVMRRIKAALDPDDILNPGKIFACRS